MAADWKILRTAYT